MKIPDVKNVKTAKRYASALYESANGLNNVPGVYNDIIFVEETIRTNKCLSDFLANPAISVADKKDVIKKLFTKHISQTTFDFLNLLADNSRISIISEIVNEYSKLYNAEKNIVVARIITAVEMNAEQKIILLNKLGAKLKKQIEPEYVINKDIIGGITVEIGDKTIDCSIKAKFTNMKQQLVKGNKYGNN